MAEQYANDASSTLTAGINNSVTSLTVSDATKFPAAATFRIRIDTEILIVTGVSGATYTVTRGAEGTTAAAHSLGATVTHVLTRDGLLALPSRTVLSGTMASIPAAGQDGRLYLPTDGGTILRDTGSAYAKFGIFPPNLKSPVAADFAWVTQGTATLTDYKTALTLTDPGHASDNLKILKKAVPARPYTITAWFTCMMQGKGNYQYFGLCWRQSSNGYIVAPNTGQFNAFGLNKFSSITTYNSSYSATGGDTFPGFNNPYGMRIKEDNTYRYTYISFDGFGWQLAHQVSRTDFITADEVGWYANAANSSGGMMLTLQSWVEE